MVRVTDHGFPPPLLWWNRPRLPRHHLRLVAHPASHYLVSQWSVGPLNHTSSSSGLSSCMHDIQMFCTGSQWAHVPVHTDKQFLAPVVRPLPASDWEVSVPIRPRPPPLPPILWGRYRALDVTMTRLITTITKTDWCTDCEFSCCRFLKWKVQFCLHWNGGRNQKLKILIVRSTRNRMSWNLHHRTREIC